MNSIKKCLNRYLLKSRKFCHIQCYPYALLNISNFLESNSIPEEVLYSSRLSYDFDYFIFVKSTKTLHAIRVLLNDKEYHFNEDIMILIRSIFEGHLASRYFREAIDNVKEKKEVIREFIRSPIGLISDYYFQNRNIVKDKKGNKIAEIKGPSKFKIGEDKNYYKYFYPFLCQFTHSSYATLKCYFNGTYFCYDKSNFNLETSLFVVFVFTKLIEGIVTVWGEDFDSLEEEKSYYDMVYDSIELQQEVFSYLISKYNNISVDKLDWVIQLYLCEGNPAGKNKKILDMLVKMKDWLYEEIGSLKKDKVDGRGKIIRQYPNWDKI